MSVAAALEVALSSARLRGCDPAQAGSSGSVARFGRILAAGEATWRRVAEAVAGDPPDFERAGELLRTRPTFEDTGRNRYITGFDQHTPLAVDARALGSGTVDDTLTLALAPVRALLAQLEERPRDAVRAVLSDARELAELPERIAQARQWVAAFVSELDIAIASYENTFGVECALPAPAPAARTTKEAGAFGPPATRLLRVEDPWPPGAEARLDLQLRVWSVAPGRVVAMFAGDDLSDDRLDRLAPLVLSFVNEYPDDSIELFYEEVLNPFSLGYYATLWPTGDGQLSETPLDTPALAALRETLGPSLDETSRPGDDRLYGGP